jgi:hypothetical protein
MLVEESFKCKFVIQEPRKLGEMAAWGNLPRNPETKYHSAVLDLFSGFR